MAGHYKKTRRHCRSGRAHWRCHVQHSTASAAEGLNDVQVGRTERHLIGGWMRLDDTVLPVGRWGWMALSYRWVGLEAVVQVGGWLDDAIVQVTEELLEMCSEG